MADEWLPPSEAAKLVGEDAQTLRRWAAAGKIPHRRGERGVHEYSGEAVREIRVERLRRLSAVEPAAAAGDTSIQTYTELVHQLAEARAQRDSFAAELGRIRDALTLALAADDAADDRARSWKGVARALIGEPPPDD
jgi:hypothetical protein